MLKTVIHIDGKSQRDGLTLELGLEVILSLHKKSTVHFVWQSLGSEHEKPKDMLVTCLGVLFS